MYLIHFYSITLSIDNMLIKILALGLIMIYLCHYILILIRGVSWREDLGASAPRVTKGVPKKRRKERERKREEKEGKQGKQEEKDKST